MRRSRFQIAKRAPKEARTAPDGEVFHSAGEMRRYLELRELERKGEIRDLKRQVKVRIILPPGLPKGVPVKIRSGGYPNGRPCVYTADFSYDELVTSTHGIPSEWKFAIEEYKGVDDDASRLRRAIVEAVLSACNDDEEEEIVIKITGPAKNPARKRKVTA